MGNPIDQHVQSDGKVSVAAKTDNEINVPDINNVSTWPFFVSINLRKIPIFSP